MNALKIQASLLLLIAVFLMSTNIDAQQSDFHIYLALGQSNMEGTATIEEQDKTVDSRFVMMATTDCADTGRTLSNWYTAVPPLSQCGVGLSPADYFGRTMIANLDKEIRVGIINVSVSGCDIRVFDKDIYTDYTSMYTDWYTRKIEAYGGNPYQRLISLAKKAQKEGVIKGIILHQGETNAGDEAWPMYVKKVYDDILNDLTLKAHEVPLVAGEVVHEEQNGTYGHMNTIINTLPATIPTAHIVSSEGCSVKEDNTHFDTPGIRELGKRYAEKMMEVKGGK